MKIRRTYLELLLSAAALLAAGCASSAEESTPPVDPAWLQVEIDKQDAERLLRYYFGGYAAPQGADPFETGLLRSLDGRFEVNLDTLEGRHPGSTAALLDVDENGRIGWDELEAFLYATYYSVRVPPDSVEALFRESAFRERPDEWFYMELDGVMTTARRHLYVPSAALREALRGYWENDEKVIYPSGTLIVGTHQTDARVLETTVMMKRADGFWDYFVYGADGRLVDTTQTPPRALRVPTQCVGCHLGRKLFEPEKSFPARAQPGPHGPRQLYVGDRLRDGEVVTFFQEHARRSDGLLGLYATLFVARLRSDYRAGRLPEEDRLLLESLNLVPPLDAGAAP